MKKEINYTFNNKKCTTKKCNICGKVYSSRNKLRSLCAKCSTAI